MNKAAFALVLLLCVSSALGYSGQATYFYPGLGACGWTNGNNDLIAAVNAAQYSGTCGRYATVHGPNGSVRVQLVDKCPGCAYGDLDLSPAAFQKIAPLSAGRVSITWDFS
eukprot:Phypoly_transcript_29267.p1 GENE.Phypoly_transcript_29267~~Phypoly_transcript_29267.p1  ORF type:complete len:128 (+),score=14.33 Phypoly_transcript_29267:53-385(+)